MHVLVSYDVATDTAAGRRRLRQVAQTCRNVGQRVQLSVFECALSEAQFEELVRRLLEIINEEEDSLRIYRLTEPIEKHVMEFGNRRSMDFDGPLIL